MNNNILYAVIALSTSALFTGCGPTLPPEVSIPKAKEVKNVNHKLTKANQEKIENDYVAYRNNIVTGVFSATANLLEKSNHTIRDLDMSKEKLYLCSIEKMWGQPTSFFHKMYIISDKTQEGKEFSVGLNYNNVNDIKYFNTAIYPRKDVDSGITIVEMSGLSVGSTINYKCNLVKNTIYKPD